MALLRDVVSRNLKRILQEKKISQTSLARRLGYSLQTVNGLVNGKAGFSGETLSKIASELKIEETDLVAEPKADFRNWKVLRKRMEELEELIPYLLPKVITERIKQLSEKDKDTLYKVIESTLERLEKRQDIKIEGTDTAESEILNLLDMKTIIRELVAYPPGRRAFLLEVWLAELRELERRRRAREKAAADTDETPKKLA